MDRSGRTLRGDAEGVEGRLGRRRRGGPEEEGGDEEEPHACAAHGEGSGAADRRWLCSSLGCSPDQAASAYQGTGTSAGGECVVCVRYPSVEYTRSIPIRILRIAYLQIYYTVQELMGVITFSWHFFVRRYYRIIAYHYS